RGATSNYEHGLRTVNEKIGVAEKIMQSAARAKTLLADLPELKAKSTSARAQFHLAQVEPDLQVFAENRMAMEMVSSAESHAAYARRLIAQPLAEPSEYNSLVVLRDKLFDEGDIARHTGDSEQVKAHL